MLEDKIVDTREGVLGAATETGDRTPVMVIKNKTEALDATLALVARGNAVLAEIERLSDNIPLLYRNISIKIVNMCKNNCGVYWFIHLQRGHSLSGEPGGV